MNPKNYIISIQTQLKGQRVVLSGLQQIEGQTQKFTKTVNVAGRQTQTFGDILYKAGKRALIVAPIWMLIRTAMMLFIRTMRDVIETNLKFEDAMAEVQGMLSGTTTEINAQMIAIKRIIFNTALNSKRSISDLAQAFRFLKSANLDFQEAMAGFPVVASLMNAFGLSAKEASRAFAGMLNTAKNFGDITTLQEKAALIGDVLAYTYVKQDVMVSELVESYAKFAPFIGLTNDNFIDLVTTLGFLNTQMLRGGRTGRLTGQAMLDMVKKSSQLAETLGLTFDPDAPLSFLERIRAIKTAIGDMSQTTEKQAKALTTIFSARSGRALLLILNNFEKWNEALIDARENYEGFLKKLEDIRMMTTVAQMSRMKNILVVLGNDLASGALNVGDFAFALKTLNDDLEKLRKPMMFAGQAIRYMVEEQVIGIKTLITLLKGDFKNALKLHNNNIMALITQILEMQHLMPKGAAAALAGRRMGVISPEDRQKIENQKKIAEQAKELRNIEKRTGELKLNVLKSERQLIAHNVALLKIMGANAVDIAKFRLQSLETLKAYLTEEDYLLEKQKEENNLVQAQLQYRQEIVDVYQRAAVDLLKTIGASESQILTVRMKILEANRKNIGDAQFLAQMEDLKLKRMIAIEAERRRELEIHSSLVRKYYEADAIERSRIRRMMELRQLPASELAERWKSNMYDRRIIDEYFSNFSQKGQEAINKVIEKLFDLPEMPIVEPEELPDLFRDVFSPNTAVIFWDTWSDKQEEALDRFGKEWARISQGFTGVEEIANRMAGQAIQQNIDFGTQIENITINLPPDTLDTVAESAGEKLKQELLNNSELQKKLSKTLRPYL